MSDNITFLLPTEHNISSICRALLKEFKKGEYPIKPQSLVSATGEVLLTPFDLSYGEYINIKTGVAITDANDINESTVTKEEYTRHVSRMANLSRFTKRIDDATQALYPIHGELNELNELELVPGVEWFPETGEFNPTNLSRFETMGELLQRMASDKNVGLTLVHVDHLELKGEVTGIIKVKHSDYTGKVVSIFPNKDLTQTVVLLSADGEYHYVTDILVSVLPANDITSNLLNTEIVIGDELGHYSVKPTVYNTMVRINELTDKLNDLERVISSSTTNMERLREEFELRANLAYDVFDGKLSGAKVITGAETYASGVEKVVYAYASAYMLAGSAIDEVAADTRYNFQSTVRGILCLDIDDVDPITLAPLSRKGNVVLVHSKLKNGNYIDVNTSKVIKCANDITGEIYDKQAGLTRRGKVVMHDNADFLYKLFGDIGKDIRAIIPLPYRTGSMLHWGDWVTSYNSLDKMVEICYNGDYRINMYNANNRECPESVADVDLAGGLCDTNAVEYDYDKFMSGHAIAYAAGTHFAQWTKIAGGEKNYVNLVKDKKILFVVPPVSSPVAGTLYDYNRNLWLLLLGHINGTLTYQ